MDSVCSSETSGCVKTTQQHNPEDHTIIVTTVGTSDPTKSAHLSNSEGFHGVHKTPALGPAFRDINPAYIFIDCFNHGHISTITCIIPSIARSTKWGFPKRMLFTSSALLCVLYAQAFSTALIWWPDSTLGAAYKLWSNSRILFSAFELVAIRGVGTLPCTEGPITRASCLHRLDRWSSCICAGSYSRFMCFIFEFFL